MSTVGTWLKCVTRASYKFCTETHKSKSINLTATTYQFARISSADQNMYLGTGEFESSIKMCDQY